ncbi:MAG: hypothetical protein NVS1B10_03780 [Candidatus Saccharimonadales bacterium]
MDKPTKKILTVDDDAATREAVKLTLEELDFINIDYTGCPDVTSAVKHLKTNIPDIIILDLHLPNRSGFDLMDIINKNASYKDIKVIMLTVDDTLKNIFKAQSKGIEAYHFIGKPFNISDLQALVLDLSLPMKKTSTAMTK